MYETKLAYCEDYHVRSLPFEWHGMNGLLSQPIPVIDFGTGKSCKGQVTSGMLASLSNTEWNWPDESCWCLPSDAGRCRLATQLGKQSRIK